jgi:hypothetical protein
MDSLRDKPFFIEVRLRTRHGEAESVPGQSIHWKGQKRKAKNQLAV